MSYRNEFLKAVLSTASLTEILKQLSINERLLYIVSYVNLKNYNNSTLFINIKVLQNKLFLL